jgi:hypothetical protein
MSMKPLLPLLVPLVLAACQLPPRAAISPEEQQKRDAIHKAIVQDRAYREYWEFERGVH